VIDGEAVILGVDGISDFDALHSGKHNDEVQLCAFDVLAMDGDDLRRLPLSMGIGRCFRNSVGEVVELQPRYFAKRIVSRKIAYVASSL
jgi:hypothetical protein